MRGPSVELPTQSLPSWPVIKSLRMNALRIFVAIAFWCLPLWAKPDFAAILKKLNVPPEGDLPKYSQPIEADLPALYRSEIANKKLGLKTPKAEKNKILSEAVEIENAKVRETYISQTNVSPIPVVATKVFRELSSNRVSKIDAVDRYDKRGDIGFCFARAVMVHYLLLENGIPQNRIAKIFAIGQLKYGAQFWDFHMATLLRVGRYLVGHRHRCR